MRTRRIILTLFLALAVVTALVACGSAKQKAVPAGDIAIVGSEPVTKASFDSTMAQIKAQYAASKNTATPKTFPAIGSTSYQQLHDSVVASLVYRAAIMDQARRMGFKVTSAEIDSGLAQRITAQFGGSQAKYQAYLTKNSVSDAQAREAIRESLISNKVQTSILASVTVSSGEIKDYYNAHKSSFQKSESRKVSHILLKTKAQADSVYQQLKAGANFATLAKKDSIDTNTKAKGGDLGSLEQKSLMKSFADVLFGGLKTGSFSKPVHTSYGWHIIMPTGPIVKAHLQTLSEASASIRQTLLSTAQNKAISDWVAKAEKSAASNTSYAASYKPTATTSSSTVATTTTQ